MQIRRGVFWKPLACAKLIAVLVVMHRAANYAHAENNCPWINEATASGLLGADAIGQFTEARQDEPAVCLFTQKDVTGVRTLRITVAVTPDFAAAYATAARRCGADAAPIQAIGNQAILCSADSRTGTLAEQVIGRVRDQIFTITMSSFIKGDLVLTRPVMKTRIYTAAEQVAGNLF